MIPVGAGGGGRLSSEEERLIEERSSLAEVLPFMYLDVLAPANVCMIDEARGCIGRSPPPFSPFSPSKPCPVSSPPPPFDSGRAVCDICGTASTPGTESDLPFLVRCGAAGLVLDFPLIPPFVLEFATLAAGVPSCSNLDRRLLTAGTLASSTQKGSIPLLHRAPAAKLWSRVGYLEFERVLVEVTTMAGISTSRLGIADSSLACA